MPPNDRSEDRDVHIYDARRPNEEELGGLILSNGITKRNLYDMLDIFIIIHGTYFLQHNSYDPGVSKVPNDDTALLPGNYYIVTEGKLLYQSI